MKKLTLFLALILFVACAASFAQSTTDLTGTWVLDVKTDAGVVAPPPLP